MPLSLLDLPLEILTQITCHLPLSSVLSQLPRCGNQLLTHRLRNGGVTKLSIESGWPLHRHQEIVTFPRLLTVVLNFEDQNPLNPSSKALLMNLPPTITNLSIHCYEVLSIMSSKKFETDPALATSSHFGRECWNVSTQFPRLATLIITQSTQRLTFEGAPLLQWSADLTAFAKRFLSLLPASLTHLEVPDIEYMGFKDAWSLLPPHLTILGGTRKLIPSRAMPESLQASLQDLDLMLTVADEEKAVEDIYSPLTVMDDMLVDLDSPCFLDDLAFPPCLTRLSVAPCRFMSLPTVPSLPSSLTSLKLNCHSQLNFHQIVALLPSSLTDLTISASLSYASPSPHVSIRPNVHSFEYTGSDENVGSAYTSIIEAFPNLHKCFIAPLDSVLGLEMHHLELFNMPQLTSFQAPISPAAFADPRFSTLRFQHLVAECPISGADTLIHFNFLPPTLKKLSLRHYSIPLNELQNLHPNIAELHAKFEASSSDASCLEQTLMMCCSPPAKEPFFDSNSSSMHGLESSMEIASTPGLTFDLCIYGENHSAYALNPHLEPSKKFLPVESFSYPGYSFSIDVDVSQGLALPQSLTELRLSYDTLITSSWFNPTLLPNLVKVYFPSYLPPELDLGGFVQLQSIELVGLSKHSKSTCPPNLTSISSEQELEFSQTWLPFPKSLLYIHCTGSMFPIDALQPAIHLLSFSSGGFRNYYNIEDIIAALPPTLTSFGFRHNDAASLAASHWPAHLRGHFPHLKEVKLIGDCPLNDIILNIFHSLNVRLVGGRLASIHAPHLLVQRLGWLISPTPKEPLEHFFIRALKSCYPNWRPSDSIHHATVSWSQNLNSSSFPAFCALLAPTLQKLHFIANEYDQPPLMPTQVFQLLPRGLTSLSVAVASYDSLDLHLLPPQLSKLYIIFSQNISAADIAQIPRSVTKLTLSTHDLALTSEMLLRLPPNLNTLHILGSNSSVAIESLPPSVTLLHMDHFWFV